MNAKRWLVAGFGVFAFMAFLGWRILSSGTGAEVGRPSPMPASATQPDSSVASVPAAPSEPGEAVAKEQGGDQPVTIRDMTTMEAMFMSLAGRLEAPMLAWAETRGMPREDPSGNYMLDQPYQQYDDQTLRALARDGDMWAQQILADRIARNRPAEAMELYRQAAASGSVYAMLRLADLSGRIAGMSPDFKFEGEGIALEQYYSLRDAPVSPDVMAHAWNAVAEMAGLPGYMTMLGGSLLADEKFEAGCQLASSIYTDLMEQRAANGLGAYPSDPPPIWVDVEQLARPGTACEHEQSVTYDFSACKRYVVQNPESQEEVSFYVCHDS